MVKRAIKFWRGEGGGRDVLRIALPLILSTSAFTLQMFIDRVFLMWYGSEAMSAAAYGGILSFTFYSLFLGTATYVNTFVAQYEGSGQKQRVGASVWQGIYFSIGAGFLMFFVSFLAWPLVKLAGHDPIVQPHEAVYFRILCFGATFSLVSSTLSCFYTGRGKTWTVMWVNIAATIVNIILDYGLIFGNFGLPRLGIAGAAIATVASGAFTFLVYIKLFFQHEYREVYGSLSKWRFDKELFLRQMYYGLPSGVQFMLDIFGFTLFITFVGRISALCLAASSMAFQINSLSFLPMIGFSIAVSTLVGQALGKDNPELAQRSAWSASVITLFYMTVIACGYLFVPDLFMYPFSAQADAVEFAALRPIVKNLLCFVAVYCVFDTGNLIFSAALKGAGDTRYVMKVSVALNWLIMVVPSYLAIRFVEGVNGLYIAWGGLASYVSILAVVFLLRFLGGKWKKMRVIESAPSPIPRNIPAVPTVETD